PWGDFACWIEQSRRNATAEIGPRSIHWTASVFRRRDAYSLPRCEWHARGPGQDRSPYLQVEAQAIVVTSPLANESPVGVVEEEERSNSPNRQNRTVASAGNNERYVGIRLRS